MVLVIMFLGAISFDLWNGFATRRDYAGAADQAAQAGANALDESLFRASGERRLDPARAEALATENLAAQNLDGVTSAVIEATADQVVIELTATVDVGLVRIFGDGDPLVVHVRSVGRPRQDTP
jgi:Flp pilus assembly protein TadG